MSISVFESVFIVASMLFNTLGFISLQCVAIRWCRPRRLMVFSGFIFVISTVLVVGLEFVLFASISSLIGVGAITAMGSVGTCGLFTFLGPATADRSATAQMLMFLAQHPNRWPIGQFAAAFDAEAFIGKRLKECSQAEIVVLENEVIMLTPKGGLIARVYKLVADIYQLARLPGYNFSFRK